MLAEKAARARIRNNAGNNGIYGPTIIVLEHTCRHKSGGGAQCSIAEGEILPSEAAATCLRRATPSLQPCAATVQGHRPDAGKTGQTSCSASCDGANKDNCSALCR